MATENNDKDNKSLDYSEYTKSENSKALSSAEAGDKDMPPPPPPMDDD